MKVITSDNVQRVKGQSPFPYKHRVTLASRAYCMCTIYVSVIDIKQQLLEQVGGRVAGSRVIIGNHIFPAKLDPGIYVATALVHVGRVSSKFSLSHTLNQWLELFIVSKHGRAWDIISKIFSFFLQSPLFFLAYICSFRKYLSPFIDQ